ncbi:transposase [Bacteroides acidifaciens]|uniref:transposase n=1 Tax=Bacteroides acidifaciens TaxID=85831 RepID=UPI002558122B|nr:transposase [Bacteroides acidifaciens]
MTEQDTLAVKSKRNCVYRLLTVFQCLLLFPCFGIKNANRNQKYGILDSLIKTRKDVFFRFMENPDINWRKALWHISVQLWNRIHHRTDHKADEVCLILDDTDHEKTGRTIEKTGRVHSHLAHKAVLGFKCLCMAVTDGVSQILLDFAIVGEKGKKGNYGMSDKELKRRHTTKHISEVLRQREKEYDMSKIELAKDMIKRAVKRGIRFSYVLADSWDSASARAPALHLRLPPPHCAVCSIISFPLQKRFSDYETIGGLFRDISKETVQLSVAQQIWGILQELVTAIARVFGLLDEEVYDAVINHSDELAHIAKFYNLKSAS